MDEKINDEKALDCRDAIIDLKEQESKLIEQRFNNIKDEYDAILKQFEHTQSMLEGAIDITETSGYIVSTKYYDSLISNENEKINQLYAEREALVNSLNSALSSGKIDKYSESWYNMQDEMHFKRKYKKIDSSRILRKNESGIDFIARDERFVKLLYYKDTWYSSHGRVVEYRDGKYRVQRGSKNKRTGKRMFTLEKEKYVKPTKIFKYVKHRVSAEELAVETFIVNYDKTNNTRIWHQLNNENDLYYKNLYPVTEKQYNRLTELQEESVFPLSEDLIMQVINAVEYKQDGWNPAHYKRGMCGIGYNGMAVGKGIYEKSYIKWKDMMQRCHDKEVHKKYKPEYADKCVCEEWQNYANFKLWYDEHHVFGNRIDLDKDILKPGNKEYSPETCVLIEHYINTIFERHAQDNIYENEDGKYFVGSNRKKVYETYDEVFEFACNKKKERIEKVAEKNLGRIPKCAYDAMLRYDVEALIRRDVIAA